MRALECTRETGYEGDALYSEGITTPGGYITTCATCGNETVYETRSLALAYKGKTFMRETKGWWCTICGEGYIECPDLVTVEAEFKRFRAARDNRETEG